MKFKEAQQLGLTCGLKTPAEWIWNVINHSQNLFIYREIGKEIEELLQDAKTEGIDLVAIGVLKVLENLRKVTESVLERIYNKLFSHKGEPLKPTNIHEFTRLDNKIIACSCEISRSRFVFCFFNKPLSREEYNNIDIRHDFSKKTQVIIPVKRINLFYQTLKDVINRIYE